MLEVFSVEFCIDEEDNNVSYINIAGEQHKFESKDREARNRFLVELQAKILQAVLPGIKAIKDKN